MNTTVEAGRKLRWGFLLVVTNAAAGTTLVLYLLWPREFAGPGPGWLALAIVFGGLLSAWTAAWAWRSERWAVASPGLVLSLAMPWGYFVMISAPVVLGLATVAGVRAFRRRSRGPDQNTSRFLLAEMGSSWIGIAAGAGFALLRASNGEGYDRALVPTLAFGLLVATPGLLSLMATRRRPALYLAAAMTYVPAGLISMSGVTLPLLFVSALGFVAYARNGDESLTSFPAPLTAFVLFVLNVGTWIALVFNRSDDPRCISTTTSTSCTSDIITNGEALLGLAGVALTLGAGWVLSRPRQSGAAA